MKLRENIYLIGFSGSGKSTIGPILAGKLSTRFIDTDSLVEKRAGKNIASIFQEDGEPAFRRLEKAVIEELGHPKTGPAVVALGGGAFQDSGNRKAIKATGLSVYLQCAVREIYRRMQQHTDRPLLNVRPRKGETKRTAAFRRIRTLLDKRRRNYESADVVVSTTARSPSGATAEIVRRIKALYGNR